MSFFWEEKLVHEQVLFRWQGDQTLDEYINYAANRFCPAENTLFYITGGRTVWQIDDQVIALEQGHLIGVMAGTLIEVTNAKTLGLEGWAIEFRQYRLIEQDEQHMELHTQKWILPEERSYLSAVIADSEIRGHIQDLALPSNGEIGQDLGRHQLLYTLIGMLYKPSDSGATTTDQAVLRSIQYLHQRYHKPIKREELARAAGLSPWHYSRRFLAMTGKPPLEYLNQYRIHRAKERLLQTGASTKDIAKQVGFEDAAYFSRRFKQLVGVTPGGYIRSIANCSLCALSPVYAEILIVLGVVPKSVVVIPLLLPDHQRALFVRNGIKMIPSPQYSFDIQAVCEEQPQFIVSHTIHIETKRILMSIAPVVTGLSRDLLPAIAQLAALFRREEEAESVYAQINAVTAEARIRLAEVIQSRLTVMVLRVEPRGYLYMGAHSIGISRVLYRELGLAIPAALNEGQSWFNLLELEQLSMADPDFIFVENRVMEGTDNHQAMEALLNSQQWKQLKAVQNNDFFMIDTSLWVGYGPAGYPLIIEQIVASLTRNGAQLSR